MEPYQPTSPDGESEPDARLLDRYLTGSASSNDLAQLAALAQRDPAAGARIEQLRQRLTSPEMQGISQPEVEAAFDAIVDSAPPAGSQHARAEAAAVGHQRRSDSRAARPRWPIPAAAGALALAVVAAGVFVTRTRRTEQGTRTVYSAPRGHRSTISLGDGSIVMLAPGTSVSMTGATAQVSGEAYFTVSSRSDRPFVVRTDNANVRVLGTRFAVRQYPGERASRIVVEDGRVALSAHDRSLDDKSSSTRARDVVLGASMMGVVTDSGIVVTRGIASSELTRWTRGTLVFDRVALSEVVTELMRAYDVDITVPDPSLAKQTMRLEVSVADDPIDRVLGVICTVTGAHVVRNGISYVLTPGSDAPQRQGAERRRLLPTPELQHGR